MRRRGLAVLVVVGLLASGAEAAPLRLEVARQVDWGYECGAGCTVRNRGRSTVVVTVSGAEARIVDEGEHELDERHRGGGTLQTTRWRTEWTGRAKVSPSRLSFDLSSSVRCTRTEKHLEGTKESELDTGCPRTPARIPVTCERGEVVAGERAHKVWRCRSPRGKVPPGTVQPWIFGIDEIVDEKIVGESRPEAIYTVR